MGAERGTTEARGINELGRVTDSDLTTASGSSNETSKDNLTTTRSMSNFTATTGESLIISFLFSNGLYIFAERVYCMQ